MAARESSSFYIKRLSLFTHPHGRLKLMESLKPAADLPTKFVLFDEWCVLLTFQERTKCTELCELSDKGERWSSVQPGRGDTMYIDNVWMVF